MTEFIWWPSRCANVLGNSTSVVHLSGGHLEILVRSEPVKQGFRALSGTSGTAADENGNGLLIVASIDGCQRQQRFLPMSPASAPTPSTWRDEFAVAKVLDRDMLCGCVLFLQCSVDGFCAPVR